MEVVQDCNVDQLSFDEACVVVKSSVDNPNLWLYGLSVDCVTCPYSRVANLNKSFEQSVKVNTARWHFWRIMERPQAEDYVSVKDKDGMYCQMAPKIGQYGVYEFSAGENQTCDFHVNKSPTSPYVSLAVAFGLSVLVLSGLSILKLIRRRRNKQDPQPAEPGVPRRRVRSLDTVRGASILLMIFVNNGAGGYPLLEHATWNGLVLGDLVFPCFMWIMGVCIPLSISGQLSRGTPRLSVCLAIVKRSLYLFLIGLCLNTLGGYNQIERLRICGVLQRLAVAYLVTGIVYTLAPRLEVKGFKHWSVNATRDILILLPQWAVFLVILFLHTGLIFLLPVPGCPRGYLGPGGLHANGRFWNCTGGATGYVDRQLLGVDHLYQNPTANTVYRSGPFDPEGVLGSLTSIFQVFLGVQAGQTLREYKGWRSRVLRWLLWAVVLGALGATLHYSGVLPVNKNLWSVSFVMVTTCCSLGLLAAFYLLVDVADMWEGGPFRIPGMNALVMYVGHQVFFEMLPFHWKIGRMNTHGWLLTESLWCVGLWICIAYVLHRKKVYITL